MPILGKEPNLYKGTKGFYSYWNRCPSSHNTVKIVKPFASEERFCLLKEGSAPVQSSFDIKRSQFRLYDRPSESVDVSVKDRYNEDVNIHRQSGGRDYIHEEVEFNGTGFGRNPSLYTRPWTQAFDSPQARDAIVYNADELHNSFFVDPMVAKYNKIGEPARRPPFKKYNK